MIDFTLFALAASLPSIILYHPSSQQIRVDRSFSAIPIGAPLKTARARLKEERVDGCTQYAECDWIDGVGVRHYFWGDSPEQLHVVAKTIRSADFVRKAIPALGLGRARSKAQTLAAARRFAPELKFHCASGTKTGRQNVHSYCSAMTNPGWVLLEFNAQDRLTEVRFDGYHFT